MKVVPRIRVPPRLSWTDSVWRRSEIACEQRDKEN